MNIVNTERRLGVVFSALERHEIPVSKMVELSKSDPNVGLGEARLKKLRLKIFRVILDYLEGEGYPGDREDHKEVNIHDLVLFVIFPVLLEFKRTTKRNLLLRREKEIVATDTNTGGNQEFACIETGTENDDFVFVVEAKRAKLASAKVQCLLALRDMSDNNGGGRVSYGFTTTGDEWQFFRFDGASFIQSEPFTVLFPDMAVSKKKWLEESAIIVDCVNAALKCGGPGI